MRYFKKRANLTRANLKKLGTVLFLRAQGLHILFLFETCVCLRMVEDRKFSAF